MTEWFRESFREQYLWLYAHRDQDEARATVKLLTRTTGIRPGAAVLDAPCGAGRHAREFAERGFSTTALDLSPELIRVARREHRGAPVTYLRADLRAVPLRTSTFDLVANLFSSFGYLDTDAENFAVLGELVRVCRPGGCVVVDFLNEPRLRTELLPHSERPLAQGWRAVEERKIAGTPPRIVKHVILEGPGTACHRLTESVRLFSPDELASAMTSAGCVTDGILGNYNGAAHTPDSPRCIIIGRKKP